MGIIYIIFLIFQSHAGQVQPKTAVQLCQENALAQSQMIANGQCKWKKASTLGTTCAPYENAMIPGGGFEGELVCQVPGQGGTIEQSYKCASCVRSQSTDPNNVDEECKQSMLESEKAMCTEENMCMSYKHEYGISTPTECGRQRGHTTPITNEPKANSQK
jgi:hypothetical protein